MKASIQLLREIKELQAKFVSARIQEMVGNNLPTVFEFGEGNVVSTEFRIPETVKTFDTVPLSLRSTVESLIVNHFTMPHPGDSISGLTLTPGVKYKLFEGVDWHIVILTEVEVLRPVSIGTINVCSYVDGVMSAKDYRVSGVGKKIVAIKGI